MSNENQSLARRQLEDSLELNSLSELARAAETIMLLLDTSMSMGLDLEPAKATFNPETGQTTPGRRAIDALREAVATIHASNTGDPIPMIAFGGPYDAQVRFVDVVPDPDGSTPLHAAIDLAKQYGATRLVVISDGIPDLREESMNAARRFGGRIDVVFIGRPGDAGSLFLEALAQTTGGQRKEANAIDPKQLARTVMGFLEGEVATKAPIQGAGFTAGEEVGTEPEDDDEDEDEDEDDEDDDDED